MNGSDIETVRFGPFQLSPSTREIERNGVPLALGDRALDILIALIERHGEIVSHRDLISRVWRGLVVGPGNLRVHMTILRKALGDGESGVRYIENVTGQGYCFVAQVNPGTSVDSPTSPGEYPDVGHSVSADIVTERFISAIGMGGADAQTNGDEQHCQDDRQSYISTDVEYALHCLLFLVGPADRPPEMSSRDLADLQGVSHESVERIFRKLLQADTVITVGGSSDRFALARGPEKISFLDVIVAVDGKKALFGCTNVRLRCAVFGGKAPRWATKGLCAIHAVMMEAESSMRSVLAKRTLADLASRVAAKAPATFVDEICNWLAQRAAEDQRI